MAPRKASPPDPDLEIVLNNVTETVPVRSIFLTGSRAVGLAHRHSDYDLVLVMGNLDAVRHLRRLKSLEANLARRLGISLALNPLPTYRLRHAKGNLFLHKVRHEGVALRGPDRPSDLDTGRVENMPRERYFSFLFSIMRNLLEVANPGTSSSKEQTLDDRSSLLVAKALLSCGELYLLLHGVYEYRPDFVIERLRTIPNPSYRMPGLLSDLNKATNVRFSCRGLMSGADWFRCRSHIITLFKELQMRPGAPDDDISTRIDTYAHKLTLNPAHNWQFFTLVLLLRRRLAWRSLVSPYTVRRRMRAALLSLTMSIMEDGRVDEAGLQRVRHWLKGLVPVPRLGTCPADLWHQLRDAVLQSWPYSETVMGL